MKRELHLNKPEQYKLVYTRGSTHVDRLLVLKALPNHLDYTRYGISVSKRVGNAVVRNSVKRRLREILRSKAFCPGWDLVIIARSPAAVSDYHQLDKSVTNLLARAHITAK
jgi:ribonuclease P protein component